MPPTVVIELALAEDMDLPTDLITAAYRASAAAHVVFIMPQAARAMVDRALDPLVADWGLSACGIRYVTTPEASTLAPVVRRATWASVESHPLRALCEAHGVTQLDAGAALARLLSDAPARASGPDPANSHAVPWIQATA